MKDIPNSLIRLGFTSWFQDRLDPETLDRFEIARVMAVHKDSYIVNKGGHDISAELVGKMLYSASSPMDLPTVGDWVLANFYDQDTLSIIHEVLPRRSFLKRKTPGKRVDVQLIGANIDIGFIIQSLDHNFNLRRLERYLVMVNEANIQPVVLLSKKDLAGAEEIRNRIDEILAIMPDLKVICFSNQDQSGLNEIMDLLEPGRTYCLLGSSGVGKTSLLNNLKGDVLLKTKEVREKDSKGRHTTTSRHLIQLDKGGMVVDTPGMREVGNLSVDVGLDETFSEIVELSAQCRFNDCTHTGEKGCAVQRAIQDGLLSELRYENYIKMNRESAYNEMSYLEKRDKDKAFGKMVKSVMKHKKDKR